MSKDRRRNLLHKNKLEMFKEWAISVGYSVMPIPTGSIWEVLRLKKFTEPGDEDCPISFYVRMRGDHVTCHDEGTALVKRFIREKNHGQLREVSRKGADILAFPNRGQGRGG